MTDFAELEIRTYVSEPDRGQRDWKDKHAERMRSTPTQKNPRKTRQATGQPTRRTTRTQLRPHAGTGGMRRMHLRGRINILKRMLIHVGSFNLSLVMRKTRQRNPRGLQGCFAAS